MVRLPTLQGKSMVSWLFPSILVAHPICEISVVQNRMHSRFHASNFIIVIVDDALSRGNKLLNTT
jgi:hypothetical protein